MNQIKFIGFDKKPLKINEYRKYAQLKQSIVNKKSKSIKQLRQELSESLGHTSYDKIKSLDNRRFRWFLIKQARQMGYTSQNINARHPKGGLRFWLSTVEQLTNKNEKVIKVEYKKIARLDPFTKLNIAEKNNIISKELQNNENISYISFKMYPPTIQELRFKMMKDKTQFPKGFDLRSSFSKLHNFLLDKHIQNKPLSKYQISGIATYQHKEDETSKFPRVFLFSKTISNDLTKELKRDLILNNLIRREEGDSDYVLKKVKATFIKLKNIDAADIKMKNTRLHYRLLNECGLKFKDNKYFWSQETKDGKHIELIQRNGLCVLDCIYNHLIGRAGYKHFSFNDLVKQFDDLGLNSEKDGISVNDIVLWRDTYKHKVSIYALNLLYKVFKRSVPDFSINNNNIRLCFISGNQHMYPITNEDIKDMIVRQKNVKLSKIIFNNKFDDVHKVDCDHFVEYYEFIHEIETIDINKVILLRNKDLRDVIKDIHHYCKIIVDQFQFRGTSCIHAFLHPKTGHYVTCDDEYDDRKNVCNTFRKKLNIEAFKWENQSYQQLFTSYIKHSYGELPLSCYNEQTRKILDDFSPAPLNQSVDPVTIELDNVVGADVIKSYSSIPRKYLNVPYPVYTIVDSPEPFKPVFYDPRDIPVGEYYFDTLELPLGNNNGQNLVIPAGFYSHILIKVLLGSGLLQMEQIKYKLVPHCKRHVHINKNLEEAFNYTYNTFDKTQAKTMINHFIGQLNQKYNKEDLGCITNDYKTVCSLWTQAQLNNQDVSINKVGDLFLVRQHTKTRKIYDKTAYWRQIISCGIANLIEMTMKLKTKKSQVYGFHTDAVFLTYPNEKYHKLPSKKELNKVNKDDYYKLIGKYTTESVNATAYIEPSNEKLDLINYSVTLGKGTLHDGAGGAGKSFLLKESAIKDIEEGKKIKVLAYQNSVCQVLRKYMNKYSDCVQTIDSFFQTLNKESDNSIDEVGKYDTIYIDEYTQPPIKLYTYLYFAFLKFGTKIMLYGDENQEHAIDSHYKVDYSKVAFIRQLCPIVKHLEYREESSRYDKELYDILCDFLATGKTSKFNFKKPNTKLMKWLCQTNKTRIFLNNKCIDNFINKNNPTVYEVNCRYQNKTEKYKIYKDMPIMCTVNDKTKNIYNSEQFKIIKIEDNKVYINERSNDEYLYFDIVEFGKKFIPAYACTVSKYQGGTINEKYNIVEASKMPKNRLYVALSRSTKADYIHIDKVKSFYPIVNYDDTIIELKQQFHEEYQHGKIYKITENDNVYIGSTCNTLDVRLMEHINCKDSPIYQKTNAKIELIINAPSFSKRELEYIENKYIDQYKKSHGDKCLNKKGFIKEEPKKRNTKKTSAVPCIEIKKLMVIRDNKKENYLEMKFKNKKIKRRYGKRKTYEQAYNEMECLRKEELIKRGFNISFE